VRNRTATMIIGERQEPQPAGKMAFARTAPPQLNEVTREYRGGSAVGKCAGPRRVREPLRVARGFWGVLLPLAASLRRALAVRSSHLQSRDRRGRAGPSGGSATRRRGFASAVPGGCLHAPRNEEVRSR